jgi:PAS domain S-box-containing protein
MTPTRVLIVDDDPALLQALPETLRLRMAGLLVDVADSARAALARIGATDYDAIVSDIKMPDMDGLALLAEIRVLCPTTPTLLITGHGEHDLAVRALRGGAYDFIQKPIDRDYFVFSLRRAIQMRQLSRQVEQQRLALERHANELEQLVQERTSELLKANLAKDELLKARDQALGEAEAASRRFRELVQGLEAIVWEADAETLHFTFVSQWAETIVGYPAGQWLAEPDFLANHLHPEDRERTLSLYRTATLADRHPEFEYRMVAASGQVVWLRDQVHVVGAREGSVQQLRGVMVDITEQKQLEEQLRQAQKMEALGKLAGGIAHDFNNLLTIITGYCTLLLRRLGQDDPHRKDLEEIEQAGRRASSLTRQLLAFSRRQVLIPRVLDLNAVVTSMVGMLQTLLGESIHLVTSLEPALGATKADPGQLEQVIMNLAVNARDAMPQGGKLTLVTQNVETNGSHPRGQVIPLGRYVTLAVRDSGCGIDLATQSRVFDPFFTTKEPGKGTGLGLSTVYGIVQQSSGYIFVTSEPGQGTIFEIYLPRHDGVAEAVEWREVPTGPTHGVETVLLVEDEPAVRALARETLQEHGYIVLEARHAIEALVISSQNTGRIDLLVTDIVMPQMDGLELATRLLPSQPTMRVLFISGYTEKGTVNDSLLERGTDFLQKPFTMDALACKVRGVLDAGRGR